MTTKAPLVYLVRENMKPEAQGADPWDGFTDFDSQLVKRIPILTDRAARGDHTVDELEELGPQVKRPEVNVDNAQLYDILDTAMHALPWYTHMKAAQPTKNGHMAFRLLKSNLSNSSPRDVEDQQNKDKIKGLIYNGDTTN